MSKPDHNARAQFRADIPGAVEQEAVRTTIVGGRPPGSGKPLGPLPRGLEVLLKKSAVDLGFRKLLLENPEAAAESIELKLDPVESAMLRAMPAAQLEAIIDRTEVPDVQRRAFLGQTAATMLAVLAGVVVTGCGEQLTKGTRPVPAGVRPSVTEGDDFPEEKQ